MYMKKIFFLLLVFRLLSAISLHAQNPCALNVQIDPPAALSCQNPSVQLHATVTPPGNYTLNWYGPAPVPGILNPVVTTPGVYALFAYDSLNQCWGGDTVFVVQDGSIPVVAISANNLDCSPAVTLTANITPAGSYAYTWSNGATGPAINTTNGGVFCVTVTNQSAGCTGTACFTLVQPSALSLSISYYDNIFCGDSSVMCASVQGGLQPYSYLWNSGNTTPCEFDPPTGTYVITVTDAGGCTVSAAQVVEGDPNQCARVTGSVLADWNSNCTKEVSDEGFGQVKIQIENGTGNTYWVVTDATGAYDIELFPGAYTLTVISPNALWDPCQSQLNLNLAPNQILAQDFLLKPLAICPAMQIDILSSWLRRCSDDGQYWVQYCNQGTQDATGAYVEMTFDPFLTPVSADLPFTDLGNHVYRFELGAVPSNFCGYFNVHVAVSCDAVLGQTHCTEAVIYPTGICEPANAQWSGASLDVKAECQGDSLVFTIKNKGAGNMSVPLDYVVIEDAVMLMQAPPPAIYLNANQTHEVKVPANGATWRVEVEQEPFHPGKSHPGLSVEGCTTNGQFSVGFVGQFPVDDDDPWVDIDCKQNVGSFDPNDKQGFPAGYSAAHYIRPGTDIEYTIQFQNTGTDTAFTVVLRDELSPWLDAGTVVPGASSHPYKFEYYLERNIKFTFDNIRLPDSTTNLAGSQGYVSFRVSPRADVPMQTDILNTAGIFFDSNEPVYTNTTVHRIGVDFVSVGAWQPFLPGLNLQVTPNPVGDYAVFALNGIPAGWQAELCDITGRPVRTAEVEGTQWQFIRGELPAGIYLLRVRRAGRLIGAGKVVLK